MIIKQVDSIKYTPIQLGLIAVMALLGLVWVINDPMSKIYGVNVLNFEVAGYSGATVTIVTALLLFVGLTVYRLIGYSKSVRNKFVAVIFFAFMVMFFWAVFEQSPNTLTTFARDYTNRELLGSAGLIFKVINSLITATQGKVN